HTVDGASNAGASVDCLEWLTKENRSQKIVAVACDAHKVNTSAGQASGTSKHKVNLNPELGASLTKLHNSITKIHNYKACKDVFHHVKQENGREKTPAIQPSVVTRWMSYWKEVNSANANQHDLDTALKRIKAPGGVDEKLRKEDADSEATDIPNAADWRIYQQYEGALMPLFKYSQASQSTKVVAHEELFWGRSTLQALAIPFFLMYENLSEGDAKDLTKRELNQVVTQGSYFFPNNKWSAKYREMDEHTVEDEVQVCRRIASRVLGVRLGFFRRITPIHNRSSHDLDSDLTASSMAGLDDCHRLNDMKIMGAILNPLYQSDLRMVAAGMCTQEQYDAGKEELLDRMSRCYEESSQHITSDHQEANEWDKPKFLDRKATPLKKAELEFELYCKNMTGQYLPKMKPNWTLGTVTEEGDPKDPIYSIGAVIKKGNNLPSGHNHAEYIDKSGHYDLVKYIEDHEL
ncbi:hypothetical protein ACHAXR_001456, partial [Thalassiosira sp. AJA248-18]